MTYGNLAGRRVTVHVGGSVAAFKAATVVGELRRAGAEVRVAMTRSARRFIGVATLRAVSGNPVATGLRPPLPRAPRDTQEGALRQLDLGVWTEVQVVVAASANLVARLALGLADDAVTVTALACRAPLLVAPAMEAAMWDHPATVANIAALRERGAVILGPVEGRHAGGAPGMGRMVEPEAIIRAVREALPNAALHVVDAADGGRRALRDARAGVPSRSRVR